MLSFQAQQQLYFAIGPCYVLAIIMGGGALDLCILSACIKPLQRRLRCCAYVITTIIVDVVIIRPHCSTTYIGAAHC